MGPHHTVALIISAKKTAKPLVFMPEKTTATPPSATLRGLAATYTTALMLKALCVPPVFFYSQV